jgi:hypothetical protein
MEDQDLISLSETSFNNASNSTFFNFTLNQTFVRNLLENHLFGQINRKESVAYGLVVLYIPAFIAGLLGNGFLTVVILSKKRLRNLTNLFLCNLAVADLSGKLTYRNIM